MTLQTKSLSFKAENLQDDGTFSGYCSVFDVKDSYGDIVKKGAFVNSLNEWQAKGKMPPVLWQHNRSDVIGVWTKLYEDEYGLYGEGKLLIDDVAKARETYALIKNGAIDGLSIGYRTSKWTWNEDENALELLELDLKEVSIVTFPANEDSTVSSVKAEAIKAKDAQNALKILANINQSF
ncbi:MULTISPECIES: HK97 family phage prohead protease [unclassified Moraxella]|uniref:HK97 family phage prohead protease n=1 Tax=unclassified Moraxella TaxID=2685852 RepID=UPI00359CE258